MDAAQAGPATTAGRRGRALALLLCLPLVHCGGGSGSSGSAASQPSAAAVLGQQIFEDTALSASGQQSCQTCHQQPRAFAANDGLAVPLGGTAMNLPGFRNAPSLNYASYTPGFHIETDGTPVGGFFRDGRAQTLAEQAQGPFVNEFEMANADAAEFASRLRTRPYAKDFVALYGQAALDDAATALARAAAAIAAYESEDAKFRPFSSKYDAWVAGTAQLSSAELNGLRLYNDRSKGNCNGCHPTTPYSASVPALFTDFTYDNLGVPRNPAIEANDDATTLGYVPANSSDGVHRYYDLGLCGPQRAAIAGRNDLCGAFKVPTLRNVALSAPYFHNGLYATLTQAMLFYVTRDTNPENWYPLNADGTVIKFDDLPAQYGGQFVVTPGVPGSDGGYVGNVNTSEVPYDRHIGDTPRLSAAEVQDLVAFLCTLTDGYDPKNPSAYTLPAQCPQAASP